MNIVDAIAIIDQQVPNPSMGLPDELFYFISRTTPLVNVDLLIKDENGRTLLAWRDDQYAGRGWHVPGGIIRFRETLETRIEKVAESELGVSAISFEPVPVALNQVITPEREIRGHFISLLYRCFLSSSFVPKNAGLTVKDRGYAMWHDRCPDSLLKFHEIYREYI
jgi:ADP-ribose pyrophosphatase YjhB (NUDIX family)